LHAALHNIAVCERTIARTATSKKSQQDPLIALERVLDSLFVARQKVRGGFRAQGTRARRDLVFVANAGRALFFFQPALLLDFWGLVQTMKFIEIDSMTILLFVSLILFLKILVEKMARFKI
jgi:hypothetical protein